MGACIPESTRTGHCLLSSIILEFKIDLLYLFIYFYYFYLFSFFLVGGGGGLPDMGNRLIYPACIQ